MELIELILDTLPKNKRKEVLSELHLAKRRENDPITTKTITDAIGSNDEDEVLAFYTTDYYNEPEDVNGADPDEDSEAEHYYDYFDRAMDERTPQTTGGDE